MFLLESRVEYFQITNTYVPVLGHFVNSQYCGFVCNLQPTNTLFFTKKK